MHSPLCYLRPLAFALPVLQLFHVQPMVQRNSQGQIVRSGRPQSLQLGEVQYVRPKGRFMSYVGDGLSGIAPLIGGIATFMLLYWIATGYSLWDFPFDTATNQLRILRPGWPWWTLIFAPYLIFTVTSELWPSHQDWHSARWFVITLGLTTHHPHDPTLVYAPPASIDPRNSLHCLTHRLLLLLILLVLDLIFLFIAEILVRLVQG